MEGVRKFVLIGLVVALTGVTASTFAHNKPKEHGCDREGTLVEPMDYSFVGTGGNDRCDGHDNAKDWILGKDGDDRLTGYGEGDYLFGGGGLDRIKGGPGNDYIEGGKGEDVICDGDGRDTIYIRDGYLDVVWIQNDDYQNEVKERDSFDTIRNGACPLDQ